MQLRAIYETCVHTGIKNDARSKEEIDRVLADAKVAYEKLEEVERRFFDEEKLQNPYSDTRICNR